MTKNSRNLLSPFLRTHTHTRTYEHAPSVELNECNRFSICSRAKSLNVLFGNVDLTAIRWIYLDLVYIQGRAILPSMDESQTPKLIRNFFFYGIRLPRCFRTEKTVNNDHGIHMYISCGSGNIFLRFVLYKETRYERTSRHTINFAELSIVFLVI